VTALKSRNRYAPANLRFHAFRLAVLPFLSLPQQPCPIPPVVVGAMGGSGTRVFPQILRLAGFWMGAWTNPRTQDAMATRYFLQQHFSRLASHQGTNGELSTELMRLNLAHRWGMPDTNGRWGWKNPRNMWIIPFLSRVYPNMKFIHVVRDGRDMALSNNTNLLCKHGRFLLEDIDCEKHRESSQLRLWTLGNRIAQYDGEKYLGSNYLLLNYEQFCLHPRENLMRLFDFLEVEVGDNLLTSARRLIAPSRNIGKWKTTDSALLREPDEQTRDMLRQFGYEADETNADDAPIRQQGYDGEKNLNITPLTDSVS